MRRPIPLPLTPRSLIGWLLTPLIVLTAFVGERWLLTGALLSAYGTVLLLHHLAERGAYLRRDAGLGHITTWSVGFERHGDDM